MSEETKQITANEDVTEHFKFTECICPCCERVKIMPEFFRHMKMLEEIRQKLGFAFIINSGYRCPDHNKEVSGSKNSWHMIFATDVRPKWGEGYDQRLKAMYKMALEVHFGGIGLYESFIHLDLRPEETRWRG